MNPLHDPSSRGFNSDNCAGVHPSILAALSAANGGHQPSYGADVYTAHLQDVVRRHFGPRAAAYPVFNGTGANVLGLRAMVEPWSGVICAATSHLNLDECAAPEQVGGLKLLPVTTTDGKLTPALVDEQAAGFGDEHRAQPRVVTITQSTELGTVYTAEEITALAAHAHGLGMLLHVDGTRLANAAAALELPFRAFTTDAGVDVLSFGGTKNGLLFGEAVLVLNPDAVRGMPYLRKSSMQLASKMRFVSAQFIALLEDDLWLRNASQANAMAARLFAAVRDLPGLSVLRVPEANEVFVRLAPEVAARLAKRYRFETWDEAGADIRWVCSFDTTEADVDALAAAVAEELRA